MQYVISILIVTVIAALAGWLVQRDSHQKSLTILTVAVIVAFSSNILNWMINGETGEAVEHDLDGATLTLEDSWTVSSFDDLTAIGKLFQNFSREGDEDLEGEWLILSPDEDPAILYCYDNEATTIQLSDLREALEEDETMTVESIEFHGIPAVEGSAHNPEKEDSIDYKQICFIANDKCYELVVYHDKDDAAERIVQKILDGVSF